MEDEKGKKIEKYPEYMRKFEQEMSDKEQAESGLIGKEQLLSVQNCTLPRMMLIGRIY